MLSSRVDNDAFKVPGRMVVVMVMAMAMGLSFGLLKLCEYQPVKKAWTMRVRVRIR